MTVSTLKIGDKAPSFTLAGIGPEGEVKIESSALLGKPYLIYFYPKALTSGCTTQACALRDALPDLRIPQGLELPVFGISPDPLKKLSRFSEKEKLNFTLLSDEDHALAESYGVWVSKTLYGRFFMGIERSSFLIDEKGFISALKRKIRPAEQVEWTKTSLAQLTS
ncbi:thioredoxin-dependent thiol peroxidase [Aristophania vespae]|uniref:thioredoxin-dependent thiol peroxidase n=1 Tax=Aristophania vespae TaxID=2697033 RepID=UPI0023514389|nr:thioredoxin-dependent thiol peroxidase [Aristophania vespae]UMM64469.1 Peroxiredoxin Bcp [Aristophania vespae]